MYVEIDFFEIQMQIFFSLSFFNVLTKSLISSQPYGIT